MAKKYRIQRWDPPRNKWKFWLSDVYNKISLIKLEVEKLNKYPVYIKDDIHFRFVEVGIDKNFVDRGSFIEHKWQRVVKIHESTNIS